MRVTHREHTTNMEKNELDTKSVDAEENKNHDDQDEEEEDSTRSCRCTQDCALLAGGIVFIAVLIAAMFGLGHWQGWDAQSGWYHNVSATSAARFLPEPSDYDPYPDVPGRNGPDSAGAWYYWKNKPSDVTVWTRLFVWLGYSAHQLSVWVVLYLAQSHKAEHGGPIAGTRLNKYNWISFGINVFFHLLHLMNTHTTYDGLAQDTLVVSSQCSVIMLLLIVLLLEYNERGLFFGWPVAKHHKTRVSKKLTLNLTPTRLARKYHGYAFAWAAIYTFWYHPMESTYGHAMGFFHTWAIMLQGSLMFTKVHHNRWWRLLLESWVTLHGALVAIQTGEPGNPGKSLWPMFLFGFLMIFCFTQIYILPFWEKIPSWVRVFPLIIYLAVTIGSYSAIPDQNGKNWVRLQEVIRIPAIEYAGFLVVYGFMYLCWWIDSKIYANKSKEPTMLKRMLYLVFSMLIFIFFIAIAMALSVAMSFFIMMVVLVFVFSMFSGLVFVLMSHTMPRRKIQHGENYKNEGYKEQDSVDGQEKGSVLQSPEVVPTANGTHNSKM